MSIRGRIVSLLAVLFIAAIIVPGSVLKASPTPSSLPQIVNIGTHPVGAFFHIIGTAVGAITEKHTPMKTKVMPVGITAWMPMMVTKEMDLGVLNSTDSKWGYFGIEAYKGLSKGQGFPMRLLVTGICNDISIAVSGSSGVKKLADLKGKRIAAGFAKNPAVHEQATAALANGGLTWDDVKLVPVASPGDSGKAVMEGKADGAGSMTVGMPDLMDFNAKTGGYLVSFDPSPEAKARALKAYPDGMLNLVKGGIWPGVPRDSWLLRYEIYVVASKDFPDDAAYQIIKAMWEYNKELPAFNRKFAEWTPETFASKNLTTPYHPGSVKFLKEKNLWSKELEAKQKELLTQKGEKE
jgi:TRAP transporter TAXI family solute receptor